MLKVLSEATSKFVSDNANDVDNTTETLGTMAKVCLRMLENPYVYIDDLPFWCYILFNSIWNEKKTIWDCVRCNH